MAVLLPEQLKAQVQQWRQRYHSARVFAVRTDHSYDGANKLNDAEFTLEIAECQSDLDARDRLMSLDGDEKHGLLLLVRAHEDCFGDDVLARFAGRKLQRLDTQEVLKEMYQATSIDPAILTNKEMMEALMSLGAGGTMRKAPGGTFDQEFAWSLILGKPEVVHHPPDLVDILRWSLDDASWSVMIGLDEKLVTPFFNWLSERVGRRISHCLKSLLVTGQSSSYLPLGLVAGDLLDPELKQHDDIAKAQVRLESYLNGETLSPHDASAWRAAAQGVLADAPNQILERVASQIDSIIDTIQADGFAEAFSFSKVGLKKRWLAFAEAIDRLPKRKWESGSSSVMETFESLRKHDIARLDPERLKLAEMAVRLAAQESQPFQESPPSGLKSQIAKFSKSDSFIDWARFSLSSGDRFSEVSQVYGRLCKRIAKLRMEGQTQVGERLRQWHADNETTHVGFVPIENVSMEYVAPLAKHSPILLLVMDGMNFPAFHELSESMTSEWIPRVKTGERFPTTVLSVLPSITDLSRWALLAGSVAAGPRKSELVAFRENPALADLPGKGKPLLLTKKDLSAADSSALSTTAQEEIAGSKHRVVAIVINAIDDQLKTGGQLSVEWSVSRIGILHSILHAALDGNRIVIMTSDHGHIREMENTRAIERKAPGEARYRTGTVSDPDEREFTGSRIKAATGSDSVILPITEALRYGQKSGGYHGGACDLEALVPLAVFAPSTGEIPGWEAIDLPRPAWWDRKATLGGSASTFVKPTRPMGKKAKKKQATPTESVDDLPLFEKDSALSCPWLTAFLNSPVYAEQIELLKAATPNRDHLEKVLVALHTNNGSLLIPTLAKSIGLPVFRMQGLLGRVTRFMNVDGYEVIEVDQSSETVRLNLNLLATQFHIST